MRQSRARICGRPGYVARQLVDADFQRVSLRRISWLAIIGSSVLFGAIAAYVLATGDWLLWT